MNHAQLVALGRALRLSGEHGQRLEDAAAATDVSEIRSDLQRALTLVDDAIQTAKPPMRCPEHPSGPVDPTHPTCACCARPAAAPDCAPRPAPAPLTRTTRKRRHFACPPTTRSADDPQPRRRWLAELWNGRAW